MTSADEATKYTAEEWEQMQEFESSLNRRRSAAQDEQARWACGSRLDLFGGLSSSDLWMLGSLGKIVDALSAVRGTEHPAVDSEAPAAIHPALYGRLVDLQRAIADTTGEGDVRRTEALRLIDTLLDVAKSAMRFPW